MEKRRAIGIIPDGNRRWAKENNVSTQDAYIKGIKNLHTITQELVKSGFTDIVIYAFSTENWNRSSKETKGLFDIINEKREIKDLLINSNFEVSVFGILEKFDNKLLSSLEEIIGKTKNRDAKLHLAMSYGGQDDIVRVANEFIKKGENITKSDFESSLYTKDIPEVECIIRTGGGKRLSNFLLWEASYAELYFSETLWPDFSVDELDKILNSHKDRRVNYGT